jgi:hypothetical protein
MRSVFKTALLCSIASTVFADPCARLCEFDGPTVCTGGSYTKNGNTCHRYVYRGDPSLKDHCYHTAATKEVCPGGGAPVRPDDVDLLISDKLGTTEIPADVPADVGTTTTSEIPEDLSDVITTTTSYQTTERPELPLEIDASNLILRMLFWTRNGGSQYLGTWFKRTLLSFDRRQLSQFVDFAYGSLNRELMVSLLRIPKLSIHFDVHRRGGVEARPSSDIDMPCYSSEEEMRRDLLEAMSRFP